MTRFIPKVQSHEVLDTAFPAHSPGFAEVCAPTWKNRDGGRLEGQKFWFLTPNSLFFFFLLIEGFLSSDGKGKKKKKQTLVQCHS